MKVRTVCLALGLALALAGFASTSPAHSGVAPGTRPNVVLISTDDMARTDLLWMPQTLALLEENGVNFIKFISPHSLCCPARAEIITGQYAQNNGVRSNGGPYGGLPALRDPDNTLARWLHDAGYHTGFSGKYLNQYHPSDVGVPQGWDFWDAFANNASGYYGFSMYDNGALVKYPVDGIYSTDLIADDTERMIRDYSGTDPFFIWSSYYAPHGLCQGFHTDCAAPPTPALRHADLFPDAHNPSANRPSFNELDVSDKPPFIRKRGFLDPVKLRILFRQRVRALQAVDEAVTRTVAVLRETGELDNTLILFTSDNGYLLGEHRYQGKDIAYDESMRVPLLVRGPGVPHGEDRVVGATTVDLAPTIVAATGVTAGRVLDGRNLLPYIKDDSLTHAPAQLIQGGPKANDPDPKPWRYRGVRTPRYTFVQWTSGFVELYDRLRDPFELVNVAAKRDYVDVVAALGLKTKRLGACAGVDCRR
ncbi:sulfatase [Nocardioides sp. LS1]|uniref:sulfatase family protein n=1 Tax=Nocardioides sp. LS1 TaxID=1027620 RepID=UPI000FF92B7C|nr:sulfatase [Nocardioides sp. LS1]GCD89383.1 sulfatase [Nocardioides sp. LS1]